MGCSHRLCVWPFASHGPWRSVWPLREAERLTLLPWTCTMQPCPGPCCVLCMAPPFCHTRPCPWPGCCCRRRVAFVTTCIRLGNLYALSCVCMHGAQVASACVCTQQCASNPSPNNSTSALCAICSRQRVDWTPYPEPWFPIWCEVQARVILSNNKFHHQIKSILLQLPKHL